MWHRVSRKLCLRHRKPSKLKWHFLRAFQGSLEPHVCKPGMSQDWLLRVQLCATWQHELWQSWDVMFLMINEQPRSLERVLNGMGITSFPKGWEVGGEFEKKILVNSWVNLCDSRRTWACWLEKTTVVLECQYELVVGNEGWHVCKCSFDCKLDFKNKYNSFDIVQYDVPWWNAFQGSHSHLHLFQFLTGQPLYLDLLFHSSD